MHATLRTLRQDRLFWLALAAGPVGWLALSALGVDITAPNLATGLWLVLLLPLVEELAFRGAVQGALLRAPWGQARVLGLSRANWLTSALFAALHLLGQPPLWALAAMGPSLVFGAFRERHHSTLPAIVLHVFYNAGFFLLVAR